MQCWKRIHEVTVDKANFTILPKNDIQAPCTFLELVQKGFLIPWLHTIQRNLYYTPCVGSIIHYIDYIDINIFVTSVCILLDIMRPGGGVLAINIETSLSPSCSPQPIVKQRNSCGGLGTRLSTDFECSFFQC